MRTMQGPHHGLSCRLPDWAFTGCRFPGALAVQASQKDHPSSSSLVLLTKTCPCLVLAAALLSIQTVGPREWNPTG